VRWLCFFIAPDTGSFWQTDGFSLFCFTFKNQAIQNKTGMCRLCVSEWVGERRGAAI